VRAIVGSREAEPAARSLMRVLDAVRERIGLVYPQERRAAR
jgi:hypothetical protein